MELVGARGAACTSRHAHIYSENTSMLVAGQDSEATTSHCHNYSLICAHIHHPLARPGASAGLDHANAPSLPVIDWCTTSSTPGYCRSGAGHT